MEVNKKIKYAAFKCLNCNYHWLNLPGPTQCPMCNYLYVKWINYEEMKKSWNKTKQKKRVGD